MDVEEQLKETGKLHAYIQRDLKNAFETMMVLINTRFKELELKLYREIEGNKVKGGCEK